jgi:5-formyltetrahydrofolate cyclo-ligase
MLAASDIENRKRLMRAEARARRDRVSAAEREKAARILSEKSEILRDFSGILRDVACVLAAYLAVRGEIDCMPLVARLAGGGWRIALPVVTADGVPLAFHAWTPGDPTTPGRFGIPQPAAASPVTPSVLLVPLLAFDRRCHRLGYGGGHYDRTLAALRAKGPVTAIGLAFDAQEVPDIPAGPYDQPLDCVLTPSAMIRAQETA